MTKGYGRGHNPDVMAAFTAERERFPGYRGQQEAARDRQRARVTRVALNEADIAATEVVRPVSDTPARILVGQVDIEPIVEVMQAPPPVESGDV